MRQLIYIVFLIPLMSVCQKSVASYKSDFDAITTEETYQTSLATGGDGGDMYYMDVSPYVYMFQITGQDSYMDQAVWLWEDWMASATTVAGGYKGWLDGNNGITNGAGVNDGSEVPLCESRGARTVARMLWVLSGSPTYRAKGTNQSKYDSMLAFFKANIWNKWYSRGIGNLYRINTHMMSHWAQIGFFLNKIDPHTEYRDVYDDWCTDVSAGAFTGSMRGQLRTVNIDGEDGYVWQAEFNDLTGATDTSHSNAEVELMVLGAEFSNYWTLSDMAKLVRTMDKRIYVSNTTSAAKVNGTSVSTERLMDQGWDQLGRFDSALQLRLDTQAASSAPTYRKTQIANRAYNRYYLDGGTLYYPENSTSGAGTSAFVNFLKNN